MGAGGVLLGPRAAVALKKSLEASYAIISFTMEPASLREKKSRSECRIDEECWTLPAYTKAQCQIHKLGRVAQSPGVTFAPTFSLTPACVCVYAAAAQQRQQCRSHMSNGTKTASQARISSWGRIITGSSTTTLSAVSRRPGPTPN